MMMLSVLLSSALLVTDSSEEILARMRTAQHDLKTLEARLEQVKSYPQLGVDDPVERGVLYLQEGNFRLEIQEPEIRILVVKEGKYVLYQPRIRQAISGKVEGRGTRGLFPGLLTGSPDSFRELEASYSASDHGEGSLGERRVHRIQFRAKPDVPVYCQEVDLSIDTSLLLPVRQTCREANGSEITLTFVSLKRNVPLDKSVFEIQIPDGVERIERGRNR